MSAPGRAQRLAVALLALLLFAFAGCSKGQEMSLRPLKSSAEPFKRVIVPGMDLFVERGRQIQAADYDPPTSGAARVHGSSKVLRGKPAFDAARARVGNDPMKLAILAMLFLDSNTAGALPWTKPTGNLGNDEALARAPSLAGDKLEYWRTTTGMTFDLLRCQVSLGAGKVSCEPARDIRRDQAVAKDPAAYINKLLGSDDLVDRLQGIDELKKQGDDSARKRLIDLALHAKLPRERQEAVEALAKLPGPGVVDALKHVKQSDSDSDTRWAAFRALNELGAGGSAPH